ncbi:MAG TPA: hydrogenase nickel incorporation protein HypB [Symbiobacteriaceae bacterium]|nr:hydrogenase nickel incorporation protein HypB [Symbiobacteriaceae bacterium]
MRIPLETRLLQGNQTIASQNRELFRRHSLLVLNLVSSPGAGKTTFLERWISQAKAHLRIGVIEGDVATTLDAERIAACGVPAVQINTHGACHLDAGMVARAAGQFDLAALDCLVVENVGNLVCPAEFDLGESLRVTLLSTAEGADKPAKYPASFRHADAVLLTKTDLLPVVPFDLQCFQASVGRLNPDVPVFHISAVTGEGLDQWTDWLRGQLSALSDEGSG